MLNFGQFWLVFELTESPLYLGYVGAANATSAITLNLFGGVYADKLDKRRLIIITQLITAALIFLLAFLTVTGVVAVWHILAIAFVTGAVNAFDQPARQALYPHLIERSAMVSAVALNSAIWQGTRIFAPAVAGVIIASLGTSSTFFIAGAGFAIMSMVIFWLHVPYIETSTGNALKNMADGLKFIKSDSVFWFLIGMTFFNSFFGMAYISMMPAITVDVLNLGADSQGTLMSIGGIGEITLERPAGRPFDNDELENLRRIAGLLGPLLKDLRENYPAHRILVLPDHPTPIRLKTHTGKPVPYMLYDSRRAVDGSRTGYNEAAAGATGINFPAGWRLQRHFINP